jgi:hypothetical protein
VSKIISLLQIKIIIRILTNFAYYLFIFISASGGNKGGQIVQTSSGQIIQLPAGGLMSGKNIF